ncbi:hypothetical protein [Hymenobacter sp. HSC-4F20]|nr:hypothetical protein [Hymenobacter sp. HSC-4F20]
MMLNFDLVITAENEKTRKEALMITKNNTEVTGAKFLSQDAVAGTGAQVA